MELPIVLPIVAFGSWVQLFWCQMTTIVCSLMNDKEKWKQFMMQYLTASDILHRVVVLIDLKVGIQDSDKMVIDMLTDLNRIFLVVLTKADKVNAK